MAMAGCCQPWSYINILTTTQRRISLHSTHYNPITKNAITCCASSNDETTTKGRKKSSVASSVDAPVKRTRRSTKSQAEKIGAEKGSELVIENVEELGEAVKKKSSTVKRPRRSTKSSKEEKNEGVMIESVQRGGVDEYDAEFSGKKLPTRRSTKSPKDEKDEGVVIASVQRSGVEEYSEVVESGRKKLPARRSMKNPAEVSSSDEPELVSKVVDEDEDVELDDGIDVHYESPPLVCCFGAAQREFVPTVRVSERQMHPDQYSTWKQLQWNPPEFVRAPGGPPSNVAISHVRLGGRAAFMGKVGDDALGNELINSMDSEKVQIRAVKIDRAVKTATARMKLKFQDDKDGTRKKLVAETIKQCAEDSFLKSDINVSVLKEARIFHFNSEVLLTPAMHSPLFRAIELSKKFGSNVFFDLNLPLPLWRSRDMAREFIKKAWTSADLIEVSRQEIEFLLDEKYYEKMRNYRPQYYSNSYEQTRNRRDCHHYTREEIAPLWHDGIKILFVTDGTLRIHYYTPNFDGVVVGTEDVLITPFTCDRTGSGDAVVAAIMRKLTTHPEMYEDEDKLVRQLRFAVAAGIISQWTIGAVRGFPTESATQNLKEQVYVPSMW